MSKYIVRIKGTVSGEMWIDSRGNLTEDFSRAYVWIRKPDAEMVKRLSDWNKQAEVLEK